MLLEDKLKVLPRCLFDVQNRVGVGRDEEDDHQGTEIWQVTSPAQRFATYLEEHPWVRAAIRGLQKSPECLGTVVS